MNVVPRMLPAVFVGALYMRRNKAVPGSSMMWKLSWTMSLINIVVGFLLAFAVVLALAIGGEMASELFFFGLEGFAVILGVVFLIGAVVARFSFGYGVKDEQRRQEKLAAKDAM